MWLPDAANQTTSRRVAPNAEMLAMKQRWAEKQQPR
jgi:hypothetical protein